MRLASFLYVLCAALAWPMISQGGNAQPPSVDELVTRIEQRYAETRDLQAEFTQETIIEGFDTPLRSSGRMFLKKPGLLRWDYLDPATEHIYVQGDQVKMYVPDHQQVIIGSLTHMVATQAPLRLLQGVDKLSTHFQVSPTGEGELGKGGLPLLTLTPKEPEGDSASPVRKIIADIQPNTYLIQTLSLYETSGNISTFHFSNFRVNQGLDDHLFQFVAPEGVVVIDDVLPQ